MTWEVEYTDEFEGWWSGLDDAEQESVAATVGLLEELGPDLPHPYCSGIKAPGTVACASCGCNIRGARCACYTPSIQDALQFC